MRHSEKPQPKKATGNSSTSTSKAAGEYTGPSEKQSEGGFVIALGETQEVFSQGILRIQPHGPRHAYFMTFLPDAVRPLPMPSPSEMSSDQSPSSSGGFQNQPVPHEVERRSPHKQLPYSPAENQLLAKLRSQLGLPWQDIAKRFKHQSIVSLQAQYSKICSGIQDDP